MSEGRGLAPQRPVGSPQRVHQHPSSSSSSNITSSHLVAHKTSLPPEVQGSLRGKVVLKLQKVIWKLDPPPSNYTVHVRWWGDRQPAPKFRPSRSGVVQYFSPSTAEFAVHSSQSQFSNYLRDMKHLHLELHNNRNSLFGHIYLHDIESVLSKPIDRLVDIVAVKEIDAPIGQLHLSMAFQPANDAPASPDQRSSPLRGSRPVQPPTMAVSTPSRGTNSLTQPSPAPLIDVSKDIAQKGLPEASSSHGSQPAGQDFLEALIQRGTKLRNEMAIASKLEFTSSTDRLSEIDPMLLPDAKEWVSPKEGETRQNHATSDDGALLDEYLLNDDQLLNDLFFKPSRHGRQRKDPFDEESNSDDYSTLSSSSTSSLSPSPSSSPGRPRHGFSSPDRMRQNAGNHPSQFHGNLPQGTVVVRFSQIRLQSEIPHYISGDDEASLSLHAQIVSQASNEVLFSQTIQEGLVPTNFVEPRMISLGNSYFVCDVKALQERADPSLGPADLLHSLLLKVDVELGWRSHRGPSHLGIQDTLVKSCGELSFPLVRQYNTPVRAEIALEPVAAPNNNNNNNNNNSILSSLDVQVSLSNSTLGHPSQPTVSHPEPFHQLTHVVKGAPHEVDLAAIPLICHLFVGDARSLKHRVEHQDGVDLKSHEAHPVEQPRNTYVICRIFAPSDSSRSDIQWASNHPQFRHSHSVPCVASEKLVKYFQTGCAFIEVWDHGMDPGDNLVGIVRIPMHELYLSLKDPLQAPALFVSGPPIVAVDDYRPIVNPVTSATEGWLRVSCALGSREQILSHQRHLSQPLTKVEANRNHGAPNGLHDFEPEMEPEYRLSDEMKQQQVQDGISSLEPFNKLELHEFVLQIEDGHNVPFIQKHYGETECFVQFFFPESPLPSDLALLLRNIPHHQLSENSNDESASSQLDPEALARAFHVREVHLQPHRTRSTLSIPNPTFKARFLHSLTLHPTKSVHRELLVHLKSLGVKFELWQRYFLPVTKEMLVAEGLLSMAHLSKLISQAGNQENMLVEKLFDLPLRGMAHREEFGSLRVKIGYRFKGIPLQQKGFNGGHGQVSSSTARPRVKESLSDRHAPSVPGNPLLPQANSTNQPSSSPYHVHLARAAGLQAAFEKLSKVYPYLAGARDVGGNVYARFRVIGLRGVELVSLNGPAHWYVTPVIHRTFCPQLDYGTHLMSTQGDTVLIEIWHRFQSDSAPQHSELDEVDMRSHSDMLLAFATVPLETYRGWVFLHDPATPISDTLAVNRSIANVVGAVELSIQAPHIAPRVSFNETEKLSGYFQLDLASIDQYSSASIDLPISSFLLEYQVPGSALVSGFAPSTPSRGDIDVCSYPLNYSKAHAVKVFGPSSQMLQFSMLEVNVWALTDELRGTAGHSQKGSSREAHASIKRFLGTCPINLDLLSSLKRNGQLEGVHPIISSERDHIWGTALHFRAKFFSGSAPSTEGLPLTTEVLPQREPRPRSSSPLCSSLRCPADPKCAMVYVTVEEALHLSHPALSPAQICAFVSYEAGGTLSSDVVQFTSSPEWNFRRCVPLPVDSENLFAFNVWHVPPDGSQRVSLGQVLVPTDALYAGLPELDGWYRVVGSDGLSHGQLKIRIAPMERLGPLSIPRTPQVDSTHYLDAINTVKGDRFGGGDRPTWMSASVEQFPTHHASLMDSVLKPDDALSLSDQLALLDEMQISLANKLREGRRPSIYSKLDFIIPGSKLTIDGEFPRFVDYSRRGSDNYDHAEHYSRTTSPQNVPAYITVPPSRLDSNDKETAFSGLDDYDLLSPSHSRAVHSPVLRPQPFDTSVFSQDRIGSLPPSNDAPPLSAPLVPPVIPSQTPEGFSSQTPYQGLVPLDLDLVDSLDGEGNRDTASDFESLTPLSSSLASFTKHVFDDDTLPSMTASLSDSLPRDLGASTIFSPMKGDSEDKKNEGLLQRGLNEQLHPNASSLDTTFTASSPLRTSIDKEISSNDKENTSLDKENHPRRTMVTPSTTLSPPGGQKSNQSKGSQEVQSSNPAASPPLISSDMRRMVSDSFIGDRELQSLMKGISRDSPKIEETLRKHADALEKIHAAPSRRSSEASRAPTFIGIQSDALPVVRPSKKGLVCPMSDQEARRVQEIFSSGANAKP